MKASELRPGQIKRSDCGVWMWDSERTESVARMVAIDAMEALGRDANDFMLRDRIINAISSRLNAVLDRVAGWDDEPITSTNVLTGEKTQWEFATPELREQFIKEAKRYDSAGRDVTGLHGLHDESDTIVKPFRAGDWVVCVDESQSCLNCDSVYEVKRIGDMGHVDVAVQGIAFAPSRFRHATAAEIAAHRAREVPPPASVGTQPQVTAKLPTNCKAESTLEGAQNFTNNGCNSLLDQKRQDDEGWVEWHGGKQPVRDGTVMKIKLRSGVSDTVDHPERFLWDHTGGDGDITHYRVVEQPKPKYRPFASAEEFAPHRDRWLRSQQVTDFVTKPSAFSNRGVWVGHASVANEFAELLRDFVFDDNNEPCGVRE